MDEGEGRSRSRFVKCSPTVLQVLGSSPTMGERSSHGQGRDSESHLQPDYPITSDTLLNPLYITRPTEQSACSRIVKGAHKRLQHCLRWNMFPPWGESMCRPRCCVYGENKDGIMLFEVHGRVQLTLETIQTLTAHFHPIFLFLSTAHLVAASRLAEMSIVTPENIWHPKKSPSIASMSAPPMGGPVKTANPTKAKPIPALTPAFFGSNVRLVSTTGQRPCNADAVIP